MAFEKEAERRLARLKRTGLAVPAVEAFEYLRARAAGKSPAPPKPRRLP